MRGPFLANLSIRTKLLYGYSAAFLITILLGNIFLYSVVRSTIERNIESELSVSTTSILIMVKTAVDTAIRSHLRGLGDAGLQIVQHHHSRYIFGEITEEQAKKQAAEDLLQLTIGKTGYVYCLDSTGVIMVHPKKELVGRNLSENDFILVQKRRRDGYIEYNWANPDEEKSRPKALYMSYFGPWDWIVSASSYRDEFRELISLDDFRSHILSITFGKTGYPYVMDSRGNLIIHPKLEGKNIFDSQDSSGRMFIQEICEKKNGHIVYPWQNPGEPGPREKLVYFNYIEEMDWIVASSSYLEEFYAPLRVITYSTLVTVILIFFLVTLVTWRMSTSITKPLHIIMQHFAQGAEGKIANRLEVSNGGEIGQLAQYYNTFMNKLEDSSKQLRQSEEDYRELFNNAAEGIFRADPDGRFVNVNPALAGMLGYPGPAQLLHEGPQQGLALLAGEAADENVLERLYWQNKVEGLEVRFLRRDSKEVWFAINARVSRDADGSVEHIEGFVSDITVRKQVEKEQKRTQEELEQRVEERTAELSGWIRKLERSNAESGYLREMGDMLQACRSEEEALPIINTYLHRLFPGDRVTLFQTDSTENERFYATTTTAGKKEGDRALQLVKDECWALRQGKPHVSINDGASVFCDHFGGETMPRPAHGSLCVPLVAQEELAGLLMVECGDLEGTPDHIADTVTLQLERKQRLASTIAEHLALALSNIKLRESLRLQSIQDVLTGLHNRRYLEQMVERESGRIKRLRTNHGIIIADLDHFKNINDSYGHEAGDEVLRVFGEFLLSHTRDSDVTCRLGGEEFLIMLMDVTVESARLKAQDLCEAVRQLPVRHDSGTIRFTVSMGVAGWPEHGENFETALHVADKVLYQAKQNGRDRVVMASLP